MKKFDVNKIHGKSTSPWKTFIENSQKILIKIHLKIKAKIRTEKNSPEKISQIAVDTSLDLIKQLIGAEVNKSNISAIVQDISKKERDKQNGI